MFKRLLRSLNLQSFKQIASLSLCFSLRVSLKCNKNMVPLVNTVYAYLFVIRELLDNERSDNRALKDEKCAPCLLLKTLMPSVCKA